MTDPDPTPAPSRWKTARRVGYALLAVAGITYAASTEKGLSFLESFKNWRQEIGAKVGYARATDEINLALPNGNGDQNRFVGYNLKTTSKLGPGWLAQYEVDSGNILARHRSGDSYVIDGDSGRVLSHGGSRFIKFEGLDYRALGNNKWGKRQAPASDLAAKLADTHASTFELKDGGLYAKMR